MDEITRGLDFVYAYIDDFLIASVDEEEHYRHLNALFERLNKYGVIINPAKCVLGVEEITFLGYSVPAAARNLSPLNDLLKGSKKGNAPVTWTADAEDAFRESKRALAGAALLIHRYPAPRYAWSSTRPLRRWAQRCSCA